MVDAVKARQRRTDELMPASASLIDAFQLATRRTEGGDGVIQVAASLALHHRRQWEAEDESRNAADAQGIARAKRSIDLLNRRRVQLVEQIDIWVGENVASPAGASLHTETFGSVVDRLAIAWVRAQSLIAIEDGDRECPRLALKQLAELAEAYDDLVRDVAARHRRLPTWRPLKRYGTRR